MEHKQIRWGIIGTARIADSFVQAVRLSSNCDLVAVASRNIEQAQAWADARDVPATFGSYDEMLASGDIDAVYIPLPNALHKEWSMRAAQAGKHILCEKPLATNAHDAQEMIEAAEANGVRLMEAFMYRFHPQTALLMQLLADGIIGEIKTLRANFGFYLGRPDDVRWSKELGGGALLDVGCYCVSIARLLIGAEPVIATARASWSAGGVDESTAGVLEFRDGVLAGISCSVQTGVDLDQSLVISGTHGRISASNPFRMDDGPTSIVVDNLDKEGRGETVKAAGANEYQRMVEHFADAVLNCTPFHYTPEDSLGNMRVLDALEESARTGRTVAV